MQICNLYQHLKIVHNHRSKVRKICFKLGIPLRGILHDLSKYSLKELSIYQYHNGVRSPHEECRELLGYSPSWLYHKNRNKHHWEFWLDNQDGADFKPVKIPYIYVLEMFCDIVGASKAYNKDNFNVSMPWDYYQKRCKGQRLMYVESEYLLEKLLWNYKELGEKRFFKWFHWINLKEYYDSNIINY